MATPSIDLSDLSVREAHTKLGELVELCFKRSRAALLLVQEDGMVSVIDPRLLDSVPDEDMVSHLVGADWTEEQIVNFLQDRDRRRNV